MLIHIQDDIVRLQRSGLLNRLLKDKTTKNNIMWATDAYAHLGKEYERNEEIQEHLITGANVDIIKTRARKEFEQQSSRTRKRAEVFTPLWICRFMNDKLDEEWFGYPNVFFKDDKPVSEVRFFEKKRTWQKYVDSKRLEITCGEAPYLMSRYDVANGELIPVGERCGILDRKLRVVTENTFDEAEWLQWATRAVQATYGYEFQGDNVLIARINILCTVEDYYRRKWNRELPKREQEKIVNIITWNIWQMNGLTYTIPFREAEPDFVQLSLFHDFNTDLVKVTQPLCKVYDWRADRSGSFEGIKKGENTMKFDFIIGNPPYQEETEGTSDKPIYNDFMDGSFEISDKVMLITPARFLFNAGKTPKLWNQKMLNDEHIKVVYYEQNSSAVFLNTDIKGGVAITYRDRNKDYGAITTFSTYPELNSILHRVLNQKPNHFIDELIYLQNKFNLEKLYNDYPEYKSIIGSGGKEKRLTTPIFSQLKVFHEEEINGYIKILGLIKNKRVYKFVDKTYLDTHENLYKYKVIIPASNGSGAIGEVLSTPLIGSPLIGYTQSFIGIGAFDTYIEAEACYKYIKSKFARTMLGILKITQHNHKDTWKYVPVQDFTPNSDIDWTKSIPEIDRQLYAKYGLDETEIEFIESHVKEME